MNLLEFSKEVVAEMNKKTGEEFAKYYIWKKIECFRIYGEIITSNSHGIEFFQNIIKYWDHPETFRVKPKNNEVDYEYNFVLLIQNNKKSLNFLDFS